MTSHGGAIRFDYHPNVNPYWTDAAPGLNLLA